MNQSLPPPVPVSVDTEPVSVNSRFSHAGASAKMIGMTGKDASQDALASTLLEGLARFRAAGVSGNIPHGQNLFSYCALERERLVAVDLPFPIVGVVISGAKEVWRGATACVLRAGAMFVLPARTKMDILNLPDERNGFYQSMILEVPDALDLLTACRVQAPDRRTGSAIGAVRIRLTRHLVDAVIHAASTIADGPAQPFIRRSRMTEMLALLQDDPAARPLFDTSMAGRVLAVVGSDLSRGWKAPIVARTIGLSESTLRRRLVAEGTSFAKLLRRERMLAARDLMERRESSKVAAVAVGYASRTHFARRFRAAFGLNPSELRDSSPA
jgi:AraC-like DNA-binding protein